MIAAKAWDELFLHRLDNVQITGAIDEKQHRELPIKADFVGKNVPTSLAENVHVQIGEPDVPDSAYLEKK